MKRFFSKVKHIWVKFLSVFCAVLISFITLHPVVTVIAVAAGVVSGIASVIDFALTCSDVYSTFVEPFIESTPGCLTETKYLCCWMDMIKDSGISEEDFRAYYTEIITRSEEWALDSDEYKTYLLIQDTSAAGVSLDAICLLAYHDTGTTDYTIDDQADGDNKFKLSGNAFKKTVADYNSRYMPMAVQDSYVWSYNSSTTTKRNPKKASDWVASFTFSPYVPVYSNTSTVWGGKGWGGSKDKGVYILPFWYDDDLVSAGTLFNKNYVHVYCVPATSDTSAKLCMDVYSLIDNSLVQSYSADWNSSYTYLGFSLFGYFSLYGYKSGADFYGNQSGSRLMISAQSYVSSFYSSDYKSYYLYSMMVSSTFNPDTDKSDDWGYYVQNKPFELFANQTQIDFNKIPDNYVITISGDTIYDYSVTNPDTGDSTTINNYITNNYNFPDKKDDDSSGGGSGGSVSGDITVSGNVDVSGKIEIDTKPIDININVNSGSSGTGEAVRFDEDVGLDSYYNWMQEQTTGFSGFMKSFFGWLPGDIVIMLCAGFALVIMARFLGR